MKIKKIYRVLLLLLSFSISNSYSQNCDFAIGKVLERKEGKLIDAKDVIVNIIEPSGRSLTSRRDTTDDEGYYIIDLNSLSYEEYKFSYFKNGCIQETRYYTITELLADSLKTIIMPEEMNIYVSNDTNICSGGIGTQIAIYANGGTSYYWSTEEETDTIIITPTISATYHVTVNNEDGCSATEAVIVNVSKANIGITYFVDGTLIVDESSYKTVANQANINITSTNTNCTYSWSTGTTTQNINAIVYTTGTYTYRLTIAENGCTETDTLILNVINSSLNVSCAEVGNANTSNITSIAAKINWSPINYATSYMVRYRVKNPQGAFSYFNATSIDSVWSLSNLTPETTYEFQMRTFCQGAYHSNFTALDTFRTLAACPTPVGLVDSAIGSTKAVLAWNAVTGAHHYLLRWRVYPDGTWQYANVMAPTNVFQIGCVNCDPGDMLIPDTTYEWQLRTFCDSTGNYYSNFSVLESFSTLAAKRGNEKNIVAKESSKNFSYSIYPNPFSDNLNISYSLRKGTNIIVEVYDIFGQKISTELNKYQEKGNYTLPISINASRGIYIIKLKAMEQTFQTRVVKFE